MARYRGGPSRGPLLSADQRDAIAALASAIDRLPGDTSLLSRQRDEIANGAPADTLDLSAWFRQQHEQERVR